MRIITVNLNGIRSAARKGFFAWAFRQGADVICVQELKAQEEQLQESIFHPEGYYTYFNFAQKKGYSGVGIYSRQPAKMVYKELGFESADHEGRYIAIDLGDLLVASLYLPSGTSGDIRQAVKYEFLAQYESHLKKLSSTPQACILCGDWNIAHKAIDLKNWRANQKHSGFLPEERAWLDKVFTELNFVDAFRVVNQEAEQYTWWSSRSKTAWAKNVGWRIDYQVISPGLKARVKSAFIYKDERFSDHAPLIIDYDIISNENCAKTGT